MRLRKPRSRLLVAATAVAIAAPFAAMSGSVGVTAAGASNSDDAQFMTGNKLMVQPQENEGQGFQSSRDAYFSDRVYSGTRPLSVEQAAALHDKGASQARALGQKKNGGGGPSGPAWSSIGPTTTEQVARTSGNLEAVAGRISALAMSPNGDIYAGAAGGGLWLWSHSKKTWTPLTDSLPTLAVGAVAVDPSNPHNIYLGTGEADLSGDSHFGDGIWKSMDGGLTWSHIGCDSSGNTCAFDTASISRLLVQHVGNSTTLYVATIRGRGGVRRVSPPTSQSWGIFRSTDGGATWTGLKTTAANDPTTGVGASVGATDLEVDPNNPNVLYASFWGDGIYKTTNAAQTSWSPIMNGLPAGQYAPGNPNSDTTRFSIAVAALNSTTTRLYAGFDWTDSGGHHHASRLFRSDNAGGLWTELPTTGEDGAIDSVLNYCDIQCDYDNVVEVDPSNPDIVYAGGEYNYGLASGGIYRSVNGGMTWQSLGFDLHPDFHALALQPGNPQHIVIGNDGGVWQSPDRGGRPFTGGDLTQTDWQDMNTGLTITQFDSIDYASALFPNRYWGGTQDNGTQRKSSFSNTWFDLPGGDGGQVLVDHNDTRDTQWAFGEYYGISPYRFQDGGCCFGDIAGISRGINTSDRSEFYAPWVMNQGNGNQLFYGTYRVYRTDNAETPNAGDVLWKPISTDLTSGCTGPAPNGGRNCTITALGQAEGGTGLWAGTQEGYVWVSPDAATSSGLATWNRVDGSTGTSSGLANRPVTSIAVDRSNWRIAYVSYGGYDEADPGHGGHVFKTTDGGQTWTNVTGSLPDGPVNSLIVDPSNSNHLFAATDFGVFAGDTTGGAPTWTPVAAGLPAVQVWQIAYDSSRNQLIAGTHGRGAWKFDLGTTSPAFVTSTADSGKPVGPGTNLDYTITVKNEGNAGASGVTVNQPIPANTTYVSGSANQGGSSDGTNVTWTGQSIPAGASITLTYSVKIDSNPSLTQIVSDGLTVSGSGASTTGSPHTTPIAPPHAVSLSTATPKDGTTAGQSVTYPVTVTNSSYNDDSYTFSTSSTAGWTMTVMDATCTSTLSGSLAVSSGASGTVCVKVDIPDSGVSESSPDAESVTATSVGDPTVSSTLNLTSIPVTTKALVVDEDGNAPNVQSYYTTALTTAGVTHAVWDLAADKDLGAQYLSAHSEAYWFTGGSYPGPLLPYEGLLKGYLDGGGHLFVSGEDLLDQAAGQTSFVSTYLHINWDGTEAQNDKATATFTGVPSSAIGGTFGAVTKNQVPGLCVCEDEITPISPATAQFMDDGAAAGSPQPDALAVTDSSGGATYKVVFLAFPFEEFGNAGDQAALMTNVDNFFSAP